MEELAGMSSEKLNSVVDEVTRDSILDRIRRLSLMNGNNEVRTPTDGSGFLY
jgi:hypothetical protein